MNGGGLLGDVFVLRPDCFVDQFEEFIQVGKGGLTAIRNGSKTSMKFIF